MARFGKPDATGRSSGIPNGKIGKARRPKKGKAWSFLYRDLLYSPAWRCMRPNTRKLIDFLLIELCNHAGTENGNLKATYKQLNEYGLSKNLIPDAIEEAEFLGIALVERGGKIHITNRPNEFTLTWFPRKNELSPLNTWKSMTEEKYITWRKKKLEIVSLKRGHRTPRIEVTKPYLKVIPKN